MLTVVEGTLISSEEEYGVIDLFRELMDPTVPRDRMSSMFEHIAQTMIYEIGGQRVFEVDLLRQPRGVLAQAIVDAMGPEVGSFYPVEMVEQALQDLPRSYFSSTKSMNSQPANTIYLFELAALNPVFFQLILDSAFNNEEIEMRPAMALAVRHNTMREYEFNSDSAYFASYSVAELDWLRVRAFLARALHPSHIVKPNGLYGEVKTEDFVEGLAERFLNMTSLLQETLKRWSQEPHVGDYVFRADDFGVLVEKEKHFASWVDAINRKNPTILQTLDQPNQLSWDMLFDDVSGFFREFHLFLGKIKTQSGHRLAPTAKIAEFLRAEQIFFGQLGLTYESIYEGLL